MLKRIIFTVFIILGINTIGRAGDTLRVLFIGNSYTYVNDLPTLIGNMAAASGDYLITASSTPGGNSLQQHSTNPTTLSLIAQGNWDYVVLQEQSQIPSFPDGQVDFMFFPYAKKLDSTIKATNTCAKTVFYMTWGRKNGDAGNCASFPPVCTYIGMDSLLQLRYTIAADSNNALLSPVAKVWRKLRTNNPSIELYSADESHPSINGSFAAACSFYSIFFKKNPALVSYNAGIPLADATIIKNTAKQLVFDSLSKWYSFYPSVKAGFNYSVVSNTVTFTNTSSNATAYQWLYGNGTTATTTSPVYVYPTAGVYTVKLIAKKCKDKDTITKQVNVNTTGVNEQMNNQNISVYPNPTDNILHVSANNNILQISLHDYQGRLVLTHEYINTKKCSIDTHALVNGLYQVTIHTKEGNHTTTVAINH